MIIVKLSKGWAFCRRWQPLTLRGCLALLLSGAALKFFALSQSDLIAYMTGGTMLGLSVIIVVTTFVLRVKLSRNIEIMGRFSEYENYSKNNVEAGLIVSHAAIPPFYTLTLYRNFERGQAKSPIHVLTGFEERRHLLDSVLFPHRGLWTLNSVTLTIQDALGLTHLSWNIALNANVEVSAPLIPIKPLPIVAASSRSGDQLNISEQRTGDLFDIKAYDPSDGISRVLWKTYARTGDLVVRRPEPAVIPEGEVALYLIADRYDDHVAGALQCYLDELFEAQIIVLFGTDGLERLSHDSPSTFQGGRSVPGFGFVTNEAEIRSVINRSVWSTEAGTGQGLNSYLLALEQAGRQIHRLILFGPERNNGWFERVAKVTSAHHVALSVALVSENLTSQRVLERRLRPHTGNAPLQRIIKNLPQRLQVLGQGLGVNLEHSPLELQQLSTTIAKSGAQLIVCQGIESA